jgi:hypothetical protein
VPLAAGLGEQSERRRAARWRWIVRLGLFALAASLAAGAFVLRVSREMPDFDVYWRAGVRAAAAEPLYRAEDGH